MAPVSSTPNLCPSPSLPVKHCLLSRLSCQGLFYSLWSILHITVLSLVCNVSGVWTWRPCVYVHMACDGSYTVVIVPLQNSLDSLDALRFFNWMKKLRDLEREKDSLWIGLQVLEQARFWYQHQLDHISQRHARIGTRKHDEKDEGWSCALRSSMQRVNGSLGSLLNNAYVSSAAPDEKEGSDWYLRWTNATLTQEVSQKNGRISMLEFEKQTLIQQQDGMHYF